MINTTNIYGLSCNHIAMLDSHIGIHREMLADFANMVAAAHSDNVDISIVSGFRHFDRQLSIWNRKVDGQLPVYDKNQHRVSLDELNNVEKLHAILLYSALPGTSRHHWGTDIDIYSPSKLSTGQKLLLQPWEYETGGPFESMSNWLKNNAKRFGFYLPYDTYRGGVASEPWHLSYYPLSEQLRSNFNTAHLVDIISRYPIALKHEIMTNIDMIVDQYVMNIGDY